jgi:hypothetical protein
VDNTQTAYNLILKDNLKLLAWEKELTLTSLQVIIFPELQITFFQNYIHESMDRGEQVLFCFFIHFVGVNCCHFLDIPRTRISAVIEDDTVSSLKKLEGEGCRLVL